MGVGYPCAGSLVWGVWFSFGMGRPMKLTVIVIHRRDRDDGDEDFAPPPERPHWPVEV